MHMALKKRGVYSVRFLNVEEKDRLLDTAEALGVRVPAVLRQPGLFDPDHDTCLFAVDPKQGLLEYLEEPFVCAAMVSSGARIYSVPEFCRLAELGFPTRSRCPVFHVPHDGNELPEELMSSVCVPEKNFISYHRKMRDTGMWDIVPREYRVPFQAERFNISRLLCDVERFTGPEETMEAYGMGFCYERVCDGTQIKTVTDELKEKTLVPFREHHERMDKICGNFRELVLFDLHSYSDDLILRDMLLEGMETPDVCIGADARYTPAALVRTVERRLTEAGLSHAVNYPYSGCFVPRAVLSGTSGCDFAGIMLEFNKRIYCAESGEPLPEKTAGLREFLRLISADCSGLG